MLLIQNAVRGEVDNAVDSQIVVKNRLAAGTKVLGHERILVEAVHGDCFIPRSTKTGNPFGARLHPPPGTPGAGESLGRLRGPPAGPGRRDARVVRLEDRVGKYRGYRRR